MGDRTIDGPAGRLFVSDDGSGGPPILLIHSLAGNGGQWASQLAHLRARRRVLAMSLRGHGRSAPAVSGEYGVTDYAADVDAVASSLELTRFVLVGHSMGAAIAAAYAAARPDSVAGLVLMDGAFARAEPTAEERTWLRELATEAGYTRLIEAHWKAILGGSSAEVREWVMGDLRRTPRQTVVESFRSLIGHDPIPDIRSYPGPATLILSDIGDTDAAAHRHVAGLSHHRLEGTGHWLQLDRPTAVNALLDGFLARPDVDGA